tara:strand:+ start:205 stop:693 length:489 start_codon:yes stop_codon:yes gene_type:complete
MKAFLFLAAIASLLAGCREPVFQSLKKTDELFVYEGLPHPGRESDSFRKEKKNKDVTQIGGHWFYDARVKAGGQSHEGLMNLLCDRNSLSVPSPIVAQKDCGPFHPDYAIAWSSDGVENYLMICYTCWEATLIGEGRSTLYVINGIKPWQELLADFQANRPK